MQQICRRFYTYTIKSICPKVPLPKKISYTELMRQQVTRVMIFLKQPSFYEFSPETNYQWKSKPLRVADEEVDFESCPVEWPKNCQISPT